MTAETRLPWSIRSPSTNSGSGISRLTRSLRGFACLLVSPQTRYPKEQVLRQIRPVLSGDAGDQRTLGHPFPFALRQGPAKQERARNLRDFTGPRLSRRLGPWPTCRPRRPAARGAPGSWSAGCPGAAGTSRAPRGRRPAGHGVAVGAEARRSRKAEAAQCVRRGRRTVRGDVPGQATAALVAVGHGNMSAAGRPRALVRVVRADRNPVRGGIRHIAWAKRRKLPTQTSISRRQARRTVDSPGERPHPSRSCAGKR